MNYHKQQILDLYKMAFSDAWFSFAEQVKLTQLCVDGGFNYEELISTLNSSDKRSPKLPDQLWMKEEYLISFAGMIVSANRIDESNLALYSNLCKRLNVENINSRNIFKSTIDNYIRKQKAELTKLKNKMDLACDHHLKIHDVVSQSELKEAYYGPKIIVFGQFKQSATELDRLICQAFHRNNVDLDKHSIIISVDRDYNKAKRGYAPIAKAVHDRDVDYFLFGPHPHSIRSRFGMDKWEEYFDAGNQLVLGEYTKMLSNTALQRYIEAFAKDWLTKGGNF